MLATRLPFVTHVLWEWDSVLYARALEDGFHVSADIADQRPHPPGYLFYVAAATVARSIFRDSNAALVAVSILASAGAAAAVYLLARRFTSRELAAFAALAFAVDPLVWAHGEIALPYIVLALGSTVLALVFWDARHRGLRHAVVASVVFGAAAGFRQDLFLVLGPLWLWSVAPRGPRHVALCVGAVAVASLGWLVPSGLLSGGFGAYIAAVGAQSSTISGHSVAGTGGDLLWYDARFTVLALAWGLLATGVLLLGLLAAPALRWARRPRIPRPGESAAFFVLWLVPGLAVDVLWIIGDWGYVLAVVPGLYVLCAALLGRALSGARGPALVAARAVLVGLVAGTALFFVGADARWSAALLRHHDDSVRGRVDYIRANFAPDATVLLAREDYQLARYYLAAYRAWLYDPAGATITDRPKDAGGTLVLFTPDLVLRQAVDARSADIGTGERLRYVIGPSTVRLFGPDPIAREP